MAMNLSVHGLVSFVVAGLALVGCVGASTPPMEVAQGEELPAAACAGMRGLFRNEGVETSRSGPETHTGKNYLTSFISSQGVMPKVISLPSQASRGKSLTQLAATVEVTSDGEGGLNLRFLDPDGKELARDKGLARAGKWQCGRNSLFRTSTARGGGEGSTTNITNRESIRFTETALVHTEHWHHVPAFLFGETRDSYFESTFDRIAK